nr:MAG TPA: hypothetical protein [Caudoviricetes sp.]
MRIWTASLVFAMRFIPMTKADFTITHIFRENPTAQKWVGALHGVNLLKRRKTIKEDKHMNADNIERVRKIVNQDGWNIIWIGAKMPCEFFDEEIELLYEDMDGQPCICYAIYTYDKSGFYHNPYFQRKSDGAKMGRCIAWRKSLKEA